MFPNHFCNAYFPGAYFPPIVTIVTRKRGGGFAKHTYINPSDTELESIKARLIQEDNEIIAIIVATISGGTFPWEV